MWHGMSVHVCGMVCHYVASCVCGKVCQYTICTKFISLSGKAYHFKDVLDESTRINFFTFCILFVVIHRLRYSRGCFKMSV